MTILSVQLHTAKFFWRFKNTQYQQRFAYYCGKSGCLRKWQPYKTDSHEFVSIQLDANGTIVQAVSAIKRYENVFGYCISPTRSI